MELVTILAIVGTAIVLLSGGALFAIGFFLGLKTGTRKGYKSAIKDLLLVKNPEAWEMARYLQIDYDEKQKAELKPEKNPRRRTPETSDEEPHP
jgi:hypothetical protein